ncbi:MAG: hypothetical protein JW880_08775 [Candidatus Thermoplasmatota archaeon]|nr:hypothetical protein [Candidatus Thermoplasmatota archaeon]
MSSEQNAVEKPPGRKIALRLGGLMTLITGILSLNNGLQGMIAGDEFPFGPYLTRFAACSIAVIFFGIIAVAGGVSAMRGTHFSLALAGALLGMMGGGIVAFFLGLLAFIFYFFADEDF